MPSPPHVKKLSHVHLRGMSPFCGEMLPTSAYDSYSSCSSLRRRYVYMRHSFIRENLGYCCTFAMAEFPQCAIAPLGPPDSIVSRLVDKGDIILAVPMNPAYTDLRARRNRCIFGISFKLDLKLTHPTAANHANPTLRPVWAAGPLAKTLTNCHCERTIPSAEICRAPLWPQDQLFIPIRDMIVPV